MNTILIWSSIRNECDYIYKASNLINLKGKHYNGERNHIAKFKKLYPDYKFRTLTKHDDIDKFWTEYQKESNKNSKNALDELKVAKRMVFFSIKNPNILFNACIEINGELAALTVGEYCGNTMIVQIEKGLRKFDGLYPVILNEFACHYVKNAEFINREDDAGDKGLRISKTQYHPDILAKKIYFEVEDGLELRTCRICEGNFANTSQVYHLKFKNQVYIDNILQKCITIVFARLTQRESATLTWWRSQVQTLHRVKSRSLFC